MSDPTQEVNTSYEKMSKSKSNGLQPQGLIEEFGADTMRLYMLFKAPPSKVLEWDHQGIIGQQRWLVRLWNLVHRYIELHQSSQEVPNPPQEAHFADLKKELEVAIKSATDSMTDTRSFNVAIASLMKLSNALGKSVEQPDASSSPIVLDSFQQMLIMLSPLAPFISEELWSILHTFGPKSTQLETSLSVHDQPWPKTLSKQKQKVPKVVVQFSGKTKGAFPLPCGIEMEQKAILDFVHSLPEFQKTFEKRSVKKVQFLPSLGVINFILDVASDK